MQFDILDLTSIINAHLRNTNASELLQQRDEQLCFIIFQVATEGRRWNEILPIIFELWVANDW